MQVNGSAYVNFTMNIVNEGGCAITSINWLPLNSGGNGVAITECPNTETVNLRYCLVSMASLASQTNLLPGDTVSSYF